VAVGHERARVGEGRALVARERRRAAALRPDLDRAERTRLERARVGGLRLRRIAREPEVAEQLARIGPLGRRDARGDGLELGARFVLALERGERLGVPVVTLGAER